MNKHKKYLSFFLIIFSLLISKSFIAKAGFMDGLNTAAGGANIPTGTLQDYVVGIINGLLGLVGLIFIIMIILGGFKWMTAQGSAEKVKEAKDMIKNAILGVAVVTLSYSIVHAAYNIIQGIN